MPAPLFTFNCPDEPPADAGGGFPVQSGADDSPQARGLIRGAWRGGLPARTVSALQASADSGAGSLNLSASINAGNSGAAVLVLVAAVLYLSTRKN